MSGCGCGSGGGVERVWQGVVLVMQVGGAW